MLIIRRSNCINIATGIVFSVSDRPVCIPVAVLIQFDLLMISTELLETCRRL